MINISNLYIVQKPFVANRLLETNEVVDTSEWRYMNTKGLEEKRHIRRPISDDDHQLINDYIKGLGEEPIPKRGRPPKNGGEQ